MITATYKLNQNDYTYYTCSVGLLGVYPKRSLVGRQKGGAQKETQTLHEPRPVELMGWYHCHQSPVAHRAQLLRS